MKSAANDATRRPYSSYSNNTFILIDLANLRWVSLFHKVEMFLTGGKKKAGTQCNITHK